MSLLYDGVNSQLSDLDFYDAVKDSIKRSEFTYDIGVPSYFRKNPFISDVSKQMNAAVTNYYMYGLELLLKEFDMKMNWKGTLAPMLDSMKNLVIGRVHYPHQHFMEVGA